jgi:hypothetical protein
MTRGPPRPLRDTAVHRNVIDQIGFDQIRIRRIIIALSRVIRKNWEKLRSYPKIPGRFLVLPHIEYAFQTHSESLEGDMRMLDRSETGSM